MEEEEEEVCEFRRRSEAIESKGEFIKSSNKMRGQKEAILMMKKSMQHLLLGVGERIVM